MGQAQKRKDDSIKAIKAYEEELKNSKNKKYKAFIEDEIAFEKRLLEMISKAVPD